MTDNPKKTALLIAAAFAAVFVEIAFWQQYFVVVFLVGAAGFYAYERRFVLASGLALAAALAIGAHAYNRDLTQKNAVRIANACERYRQDHGVYPSIMESLLPEYLSDFPPAKIALLHDEFDYSRPEPLRATLTWVVFPPIKSETVDITTLTR